GGGEGHRQGQRLADGGGVGRGGQRGRGTGRAHRLLEQGGPAGGESRRAVEQRVEVVGAGGAERGGEHGVAAGVQGHGAQGDVVVEEGDGACRHAGRARDRGGPGDGRGGGRGGHGWGPGRRR